MMPYNPPPPVLQIPGSREHHHLSQMVVGVPVPINPYQRVQQIIQEISRTVPQSQRTEVFEATLQFMSHNDTAIHDYEIDMGADRALCLQLGYLDMMLNSSSPTNSQAAIDASQAQTKDQTLICCCLIRIYHCSREYRLRSFRDIGKTDLVPILAKILRRHADNEEASDCILVPVLRTLRLFAKLDSHVKSSLLRWKNGRLVSVLVDLLERKTKAISIGMQKSAAVMESLGIIRDLSFRLSDNDNEFLYSFLQGMLVHFTTNSKDLHPVDGGKVLEAVAAIYWNVATASKLSLEMAHKATVLRSLDRLLLYKGTGSCTEHIKIKRNAMSALGNIVAALTDTRKGIHRRESNGDAAVFRLQTWIRPRLFKILQEEEDKDIQRRVMRTIRCLASCSWGRSFLWDSNTDLESFLTTILKKQDFDVLTKIQMHETVGCLTQDEVIMEGVGPMLKKALIQIITNFNDQQQLDGQAGLIAVVCKALFLCLERSAIKSCSFPFYKTFFSGILACSKVEPEKTHPPIAKLLIVIAIQEHAKMSGSGSTCEDGQSQSKNDQMSLIQNEILSTPVLDTIAELLQPVGPSFEQSQNDALDLIQMFLHDTANRKVLADNEGLLTALVGFALIAAQDKKKCAKHMILELVPEL